MSAFDCTASKGSPSVCQRLASVQATRVQRLFRKPNMRAAAAFNASRSSGSSTRARLSTSGASRGVGLGTSLAALRFAPTSGSTAPTRNRSSFTCSPNERSRWIIGWDRSESSFDQAADDATTISNPRSSRMGRVLAAILVPTAVSQSRFETGFRVSLTASLRSLSRTRTEPIVSRGRSRFRRLTIRPALSSSGIHDDFDATIVGTPLR